MPPTNPENEPEHLYRWKHERADWHRAMLLWAMQTPAERSVRATARAHGVTEGSIRKWKRVRRWEHRVAFHGDEADQVALDLYRDLYMADFGKLEIPHVAKGIIRELGSVHIKDDPVMATVQLARDRISKATGKTMREVEQAVAQTARTKQVDARKDAERHMKLVDGALGVIARKMKANEIKVSVRDIPILLECRERLVRVAAGPAGDGHGIVVDSARVKYAKETGGDVLDAMFTDAEECVLILGALRGRQGVDLDALSKEDQAVREQLQASGEAS